MMSGNLLYASDKAVHDALLKRKFTKADLKQLFISRGVLVSNKTERKDIAKYFSRLNHDYYDHQSIASVLGVTSRKEKTSITNVNNFFDNDALERAIHKVCTEQQTVGDVAEVRSTPKGFELRLNYIQIDYSKSEFSQVVHKDAIISVESEKKKLSIRWPLNDYIFEVKEKLLDSLSREQIKDKSLNIEEIELSNIYLPETRTQFFIQLINSIKGYPLYDVTDVYAYHPKESVNDEDDDIGVHISKASLKGEGVLNSDELASFYDRGFYIWKIRWISDAEVYTSGRFEFEAQFSDPEQCKIFSYMILGVYKHKSGKNYNKGRKSVSSLDEAKLSKLIEQAAEASLTKIKKSFLGELDENESSEMV